MKPPALLIAATLVPLVLISTGPIHARDLSIDERVQAQEAIERIYYSHQIGATRPFEEAVPRHVLEEKVHTYLKQSVALEEFWHTPVTGAMLREELERIVRNTRMPGRLREVFEALNGDQFLLQECLARPSLVDRLVRSFYSADERIHAASRAEAEELRRQLASRELDPLSDAPNRWVVPVESASAAGASPGKGRHSPIELIDGSALSLAEMGLAAGGSGAPRAHSPQSALGPVENDPEAYLVKVALSGVGMNGKLAVYAIPKVTWDAWWAVHQSEFDESHVAPVATKSLSTELSPGVDPGALDCIAGNTWSNGSLDALPQPRGGHAAVWTGSLMLIWGGAMPIGYGTSTNTGGRYDPLTDSWTQMSMLAAPEPRLYATAVWTGHEMLVWGGELSPVSGGFLGSGGRYDPVRDTWTPISTSFAPTPRAGHTAVWTGSKMIIWGGAVGPYDTSTGGVYDPATDTWTITSYYNAPSPRIWHQAVWTGSAMIVWGGVEKSGPNRTYPGAGGIYYPDGNYWRTTSIENAPEGREQLASVWTGSEMLVWGGESCQQVSGNFYQCRYVSEGGRYDPVTDRWRAISADGEPRGRMEHHAVWTGTEMVIWGGANPSSLGNGGRYNPDADSWEPVSMENAPSARSTNSMIWTGDLVIVWGGTFQPDGGRYDPATDTWTPTATASYFYPRVRQTAVWTGSEMVIWGGRWVTDSSTTSEGSRYDPLLDVWSPVSRNHAPSSRGDHSAVWTGATMIVWGGRSRYLSSYSAFNTGGKYDPRTNSWSATSTEGAPTARSGHSSIWTGSRMIVWGGSRQDGNPLDTGAQYDPEADTWTPVSMTDAPAARSGQAAVWTGQEMIIWGGDSNIDLNSGGLYDPVLDRWTSTALLGAPSARHGASAVWTGTEMLVWGGVTGSLATSTGSRYDPETDSWRAMSQSGAPAPRTGQTAIWTAKEMVVWGGQSQSQALNTGGRYAPLSDGWTDTSLYHAPEARWDHTAVWTGEMMIIWGGPYLMPMPTGGRYFPNPAGRQVAADAGPDLTVECAGQDGTVLTLAGSGSNCDSTLDLSYSWTGPFEEGNGRVEGADPAVTLPLGQSTLALQVDDGLGHAASDTVTVQVRDTTPPSVVCPVVAPIECASADGTPVMVSPPQVSDVCDPNPEVVNSHGPGGADATGAYPLGQTEVEITATDASGNAAGCAFPVSVRDTTPPRIASTATPSILWPPNHRMVGVAASVAATDACSTPTIVLESLTSSEPDDDPGQGDGSTSGDVQGATVGTNDLDFQLRAERSGAGKGRTYEATYLGLDASGNYARSTLGIVVPHDQEGSDEPVILSAQELPEGTRLAWAPVPNAGSYKVIRGILGNLRDAGSFIELGQVTCIADGRTDASTEGSEDGKIPGIGEAFFYLVSYVDGQESGYGSPTAAKPRMITSGGCE